MMALARRLEAVMARGLQARRHQHGHEPGQARRAPAWPTTSTCTWCRAGSGDTNFMTVAGGDAGDPGGPGARRCAGCGVHSAHDSRMSDPPRGAVSGWLARASWRRRPSLGRRRTPGPDAARSSPASRSSPGTPSRPLALHDWGAPGSARPGRRRGLRRGRRPRHPAHRAAGVRWAARRALLVSDDFGQTWSGRGPGVPVLTVLPSRYPLSDPTVSRGRRRRPAQVRRRRAAPSVRPRIGGTPVHRLEWPGRPWWWRRPRRARLQGRRGDLHRPGTGCPPGEVRALALSSFFAVDPVLFAGVGDQGVFRSVGRRPLLDRGRPGRPRP